MEQRIIKSEKLTNYKWINLFRVQYINSKQNLCNWIFASRKKDPFKDKGVDAVVLVVLVDTSEGPKLVVTKEYRAPISDYEYGFPAGLIDKGKTLEETVKKELKEETGLNLVRIIGKSNPVVSTAGLSDESAIIVFLEASGEIKTEYQEKTEDIEAFLYDIKDISNLLTSDKKIGAKAWGILYYFSKMGKIELI